MADKTLEEKVDAIVARNVKWDQDIKESEEKQKKTAYGLTIFICALLIIFAAVTAFEYGYHPGYQAAINSIIQKATLKFIGVDI